MGTAQDAARLDLDAGADPVTVEIVAVADFDEAPRDHCERLLRQRCVSRRWVAEVGMGRPYVTLRRLVTASDDVFSDLGWGDLTEALTAFPMSAGATAREQLVAPWARWSMVPTNPGTAGEIRSAVEAYEDRFGHAFVCLVPGKSAAGLLAGVQSRAGSPTEQEREVVRDELRAVVRLGLITGFR